MTSSGARKKTQRKATLTAMATMRAIGGSSVTRATARRGSAALDMTQLPPAPTLRRVDDKQHHERDGQHDRGYRGGAVVVVFLELNDDEQRRDFRDVGNIA